MVRVFRKRENTFLLRSIRWNLQKCVIVIEQRRCSYVDVYVRRNAWEHLEHLKNQYYKDNCVLLIDSSLLRTFKKEVYSIINKRPIYKRETGNIKGLELQQHKSTSSKKAERKY